MLRTEEKVMENIGLVHYVLQKQLHIPVGHVEYEDLYQEGVIGLIRAIDRFDDSTGHQFSTFAVPYIRGTVQRYKRDFSLPVHCSRCVKDAIFKVSNATSAGLSLKEVEDISGLSHSEVYDALCVLGTQSLQQELSEGLIFGDIVPSEGGYEQFIASENIYSCIHSISNSIKNSKHKCLWLDFIYNAMQGDIVNQKVLGYKHGMSQAQVSRILKKYNEQLKILLEQG